MRELVRGLLRIKVRPYYLFHCDPVTGAGHFRTSIWKGVEIIEGLRGHVSGLAVPTYVVDGLHGAGKIPLSPNYLVSASDDAVVLRNYEGMMFRYEPQSRGSAQSVSGGLHAEGVSGILSGAGQPLILPGTTRHRRRQSSAKNALQVEVIAADSLLITGKVDANGPLNSSQATQPGPINGNGLHR
jgi:lysine 2,3-aminomutase